MRVAPTQRNSSRVGPRNFRQEYFLDLVSGVELHCFVFLARCSYFVYYRMLIFEVVARTEQVCSFFRLPGLVVSSPGEF